MNLTIVNPLPRALAHYVGELAFVIRSNGWPATSIDDGGNIEGIRGVQKLTRAFNLLYTRIRRSSRIGVVIVAWPAFGYLDIVTWASAARRGHVIFIIHDVQPLRRQFGYGSVSRWLFRIFAQRASVTVLCHTQSAANELFRITRVRAEVATHPLMPDDTRADRRSAAGPVRVLGQYKPTRSLQSLEALSQQLPPGTQLEIFGRGWPAVRGWAVENRFLSEEEFETRLQTAGCVVIPYDRFYQSGVAVRCLESCVPVVALPHPQIEELFGMDWCGLVRDGDWSSAVARALTASSEELLRRRDLALGTAKSGWRAVLAGVPGGPDA